MEKEILELINGCDSCTVKKEFRKLKKLYEEEHNEKNKIIEANIKLVDINRWLNKDIKTLCEFVSEIETNETIKEIVSRYKEEK